MQQGGSSSPFDRNMGIKLALKAASWLEDELKKCCTNGNVYTMDPKTIVVLGLKTRNYSFTPVIQLAKDTNFE